MYWRIWTCYTFGTFLGCHLFGFGSQADDAGDESAGPVTSTRLKNATCGFTTDAHHLSFSEDKEETDEEAAGED